MIFLENFREKLKNWDSQRYLLMKGSAQFSRSVQLFVILWIAVHQAFLSITNSQSLPKFMSRWCHPTISSSVIPFSSCPQSLPASESFQMSQLFASGGQSTGVSASTSVLPMNTQDWSLSGCQESSPAPQFKTINSLAHSFIYSSTLTSIHDHWKNHSLDQTNLCWQSNVSAFEYAI